MEKINQITMVQEHPSFWVAYHPNGEDPHAHIYLSYGGIKKTVRGHDIMGLVSEVRRFLKWNYKPI